MRTCSPREPGQPIELDIFQGDSDLIVDNVQRYSAGLPLRNLIDKQRGY